MKKLIVGILLTLSFSTHAGTSSGIVTNLILYPMNQVVIKAGNISNSAACAGTSRFVIDLMTEFGRAAYAMMLSAQAQNKPVNIVGKNSCDIRPNVESVKTIQMQN